METSTSSPSQIGLETRIVCRVCQKQFSKYTCPRCNLRYCPLACYKVHLCTCCFDLAEQSHSLRCTESFMRENVLQEMREVQTTDELKGKTMEMLKRFHFDKSGRSILEDESFPTDEDNSDGSERTVFSEATVQRILEGAVPTLDELSEEERKPFMRSLEEGEVSRLIHPWIPWWLNPTAKSVTVTRQGTGLVQLLDLSLVKISSQPVRFTIEQMEVDSSTFASLETACFSERADPKGTFSVAVRTSGGALPGYVGEALSGALQTVCSPMFKDAGGPSFRLAMYDDCVALLRLGRACIICALADLHNMLENAKQDLDSDVGPTKREGTGTIQESKSSNVFGSPSANPKAGRLKSMMSGKVMGHSRRTYPADDLPSQQENKRNSERRTSRSRHGN